jgi:DnaJ-class molecular chaperone
LGATVKIDTISGKGDVKILPGTVHDQEIVLEGHGISKLPPNQREKGNHYVKVKIAIPKKLTDA